MKHKINLVLLLLLSTQAFAVVNCPHAVTVDDFFQCSLIYLYDPENKVIINPGVILEMESLTAPGQIWRAIIVYDNTHRATPNNPSRFDKNILIITVMNHTGIIQKIYTKDAGLLGGVIRARLSWTPAKRIRRAELVANGGGPATRSFSRSRPFVSSDISGRGRYVEANNGGFSIVGIGIGVSNGGCFDCLR